MSCDVARRAPGLGDRVEGGFSGAPPRADGKSCRPRRPTPNRFQPRRLSEGSFVGGRRASVGGDRFRRAHGWDFRGNERDLDRDVIAPPDRLPKRDSGVRLHVTRASGSMAAGHRGARREVLSSNAR